MIQKPDASTPHQIFNWQTGKESWAVREGNWKLLGNPRDTSNKAEITEDDKLFLVNLAQDVTEMKNLAKDHPGVVERLKQYHEEWAERGECSLV